MRNQNVLDASKRCGSACQSKKYFFFALGRAVFVGFSEIDSFLMHYVLSRIIRGKKRTAYLSKSDETPYPLFSFVRQALFSPLPFFFADCRFGVRSL